MALQICPQCQEVGITWSYDDERTPTTAWYCMYCEYTAYEDESYERVCADCGNKTELRLEDEEKIYWWCCRCNQVTVISEK